MRVSYRLKEAAIQILLQEVTKKYFLYVLKVTTG